MKYIGKNIYSFLKKDRFLFTLVVLSIAVSVLMIHFSYGLFQNYQLEKRYHLSGVKEFHVTVQGDFAKEEITQYQGRHLPEIQTVYRQTGEAGEYVTTGMLRDFAKRMGNGLKDSLDYLKVYPVVEKWDLECGFSVEDGCIVSSPSYDRLFNQSIDYFLSRGRNFTKAEYESGEKVALCWDLYRVNYYYDENDVLHLNSPITESMMTENNTLQLGDEHYRIIGFGQAGGKMERPIIPVTSLPENTPLMGTIDFHFHKSVTLQQYHFLEKIVEETFGDLATLQPLSLPPEESIYLYNTMIGIAGMISVISALNFAILYRYILTKRKKDFKVFRICGLSFWRTVSMYLAECILITLPVYMIGIVLFALIILPNIAVHYEYMDSGFSPVVYLSIFVLYTVVSVSILLLMVVMQLRINEEENIGGGYQ